MRIHARATALRLARTAVLFACLTSAASGAFRDRRARSTPLLPHNLLVILLDDVGTDKLSLYDGAIAPPYAKTPGLDALAAGGIKFTRGYASPLCSTTRACLQTGRYAFRTGLGENTITSTNPDTPLTFSLADAEVFLPELLALGIDSRRLPAPMRCGYFGKWHMTYNTDSVSNGNEAHAVANGYDRFYGAMSNATPLHPHHFQWRKIEHDRGSAPRESVETSWSASVVRADALAWIQAQPGPFFAMVAFSPPHAPFQVPPLELLPESTRDELALGGHTAQDVATSTSGMAELFYRAALEGVDHEIRALLAGIGPVRLANTMVFVVGDNGTPAPVILPPHDALHGKNTVYELGLRVPLIVSGPLVQAAGSECSALVSTVDLWGTLAAIAGADPGRAFDALGVSPHPLIDSIGFEELLAEPAGIGPRALAFAQLFGPNGISDPADPTQCLLRHERALTDGTYKYIRRQVEKAPGDLCLDPAYTEQFFHLASDPAEAFDLLLDELQAGEFALLEYLRAEMTALSGE